MRQLHLRADPAWKFLLSRMKADLQFVASVSGASTRPVLPEAKADLPEELPNLDPHPPEGTLSFLMLWR